MIEQKNVNLAKKTTFKVGGVAKNFYIPETTEELVNLVKKLKSKNQNFYILSGGSNILINDEKKFENIIYMEKMDTKIYMIEDGIFYIGASNRIQKVIRNVNNAGYGGFEELFCLPAMFGGIIYMNAGIGYRFEISDFVTKVKVFDIQNEQIIEMNKDECEFKRRSSIFQTGKYIILGAEIKLHKQSLEESNSRIEKRKEYCKNNQEWGNGCFGTCFSKCSGKILKFVSLFYRNKKGIKFAKNNCNWLINDGTGNYKQAMSIINKVCLLHKICHKKIKKEVIIWD